jgi:ubiquinol-cytochrome c reductase cytochrome b subunit
MSTTQERAAAQKRFSLGKSSFDTVDERLGSSRFLTSVLDKIFPDHWSFMVGEVALDSLIVLILTGVYLTFFFVPSQADVVYAPTSGYVYHPLVGQHMSAAYQSVLNISFNVRFGLVMRQAHHWAALVFLAAVVFHMCRVFFTGAFRKPREINWIIGLPVADGHAGGLHGLLASGRFAVRYGSPGHLLDRRGHPPRRHVAGVHRVGWAVPG